MKDLVNTIQTNMRLRLAQYGMSITVLAAMKGTKRSTVSAWINSPNPTLRSVEKLASLIDVPVWALLNPNFDPKDYPEPEWIKVQGIGDASVGI